ncbi:MAG: GntR family transcriptional regulator [Acidobacteria bacterium]|nr:GntR family transcriptional regulator [Acidobacteriota bacterium]
MKKSAISPLPLSISHLEPLSADQPGRLVAQIISHLEAVLAEGTVQPGGRLPSERTVAIDLRVSRTQLLLPMISWKSEV